MFPNNAVLIFQKPFGISPKGFFCLRRLSRNRNRVVRRFEFALRIPQNGACAKRADRRKLTTFGRRIGLCALRENPQKFFKKKEEICLDLPARIRTLQGFKNRQSSSVVEQRTHKPLVGGPNPLSGTISKPAILHELRASCFGNFGVRVRRLRVLRGVAYVFYAFKVHAFEGKMK